MRQLAKYSPDKLVELLGERLASERAGVLIYDVLIAELESSNDERVQRALPALREFRDEEHDHVGWLAAQIRSLGGDVVETIDEIVLDGHPDPARLFQALHLAALADNAGWQLLVTLAADAGDREAKKAFKQRMREEREHLAFVRRAVEQLARSDVLGEELRLPASQ